MIEKKLAGPVVLVRGAGELATGVAWVLARVGYRVILTEVAQPLMVRWPVCFGTAVGEGQWEVEDVKARLVSGQVDFSPIWAAGEIPLIVDPELQRLEEIKPDILIDAIMAKRNLGTQRGMAALTIGLGPGFNAGHDVDIVIETNRGHNLARLIYSGPAEPNTGVPGEIGGATAERVIYSPKTGVFKAYRKIGEQVTAGDLLGEIEETKVTASITGVLRGLLQEGTYIKENVKTGDIDPRGQREYCWTISEKARSIGMAALLAVREWENSVGKG